MATTHSTQAYAQRRSHPLISGSPANQGSMGTPDGDFRTVQLEEPSGFQRIWDIVVEAFRAFGNWLISCFQSDDDESIDISPRSRNGSLMGALDELNPVVTLSSDSHNQAPVLTETVQVDSTVSVTDSLFYQELANVTPAQKEALKTIVLAGGDESISSFSLTGTVVSNGAQLANLHPIILCALVFSHQESIHAFNTIKSLPEKHKKTSYWDKPALLERRVAALETARTTLQTSQDIDKYLPGFCHMMGIDPSFVNAKKTKNWDEIFIALAEIGLGTKKRFEPAQNGSLSEDQVEIPVVNGDAQPEGPMEMAESSVTGNLIRSLSEEQTRALNDLSAQEKYDSKKANPHWKALHSADPYVTLVALMTNESFVAKFQKRKGFHPLHSMQRESLIKDMSLALYQADSDNRVFRELTSTKAWEKFLTKLSETDALRTNHQGWVSIAKEVEEEMKGPSNQEKMVNKAREAFSSMSSFAQTVF
ncbi:MAG: hypothetical protein HKM07_07060 [Chlamydiae bacterium]|nr:hypothetical protein [Chlamydiota bacterium]